MTPRAENGLLIIAWAMAVIVTGLYGVFRMTQVASTIRRVLDWLPVCGAVWIGLAVAEMRGGIPSVSALINGAFLTAGGAAAIYLRVWLTGWRSRYWDEAAARDKRSAYRPTDFSTPRS